MLDLELAEWAVKYIDAHLSATLSVKVIAAARGVDASDLERAFHRTYHVTIKSYVDGRLKEVVIDRVRAGNCKGCALAEELGFRSDRAFYRWCKHAFGIPWRQVKARYQTNTPRSPQ
jgi:methylphosphotriester-DNA--protein-cysteine methyltransferase